MTKHTSGPWSIRRSNDGSGDVGITAQGLPNVIAECFGAIRHRAERAADEAYANARLIAAAPDVLAAIKPFVKEAQRLGLSSLRHDDERLTVFVTAGEIRAALTALARAEDR